MKSIVCLLLFVALVQGAPSHQTRLLGAQNVTSPETYPYQAQILYLGEFLCSGTVYTDRLIITSANCIRDRFGDPEKVLVKVGTLIQGDDSGDIYAVNKLVAHERASNLFYDIGLVQTKERIVFSSVVQPVPSLATELPKYETYHNVTGWGVTDQAISILSNVLQVSTFFIGHPAACEDYITSVFEGVICFFASGGRGRGICDGDNGNPAVRNGELIGLATFRYGECGSGSPSGFTSIPYFYPWILEKTALLQDENNH